MAYFYTSNQKMVSFISKVMFLGGLLFLSGCVSVLPETAPPAPRYTISSVTPANSSNNANVEWSLVVDDPTASQLYNGVKVALTRFDNRFEFFAGTEWTDRAPVLFQRALVRSFENSGRILQVGDFSTLPVSDYVLKTDMRSFHVDYTNGNPVVTVQIYGRLSGSGGDKNAVKLFTGTQSISSDDLSLIMSGFDTVLDQVLTDIVQWSLSANALNS